VPATGEQQRKRRISVASQKIAKDGHVVCVCGQLFLEPEPYVDHVAECEHAQRGETAAQGSVDFEKD
jgi:hypothetical protein